MPVASRLGDATMEMNHRWDAVAGGDGGWNCGVPWKNVLWREMILPRHIRGDAMDGLDCGTGNCCRFLGNSVSKNRSWGKISVKFPCFEEHANLEMVRTMGMEGKEFGHVGEVIDEHGQFVQAYELLLRITKSSCR